MEVELLRYSSMENDTLGLLYVNGIWECYTLEDEYRAFKVKGDTRIPAGRYELALRKELTPLTKKYRRLYNWFKWHIEIREVPDFKNVYIHIGNDDTDTEGCPLVGDTVESNMFKRGFVGRSTQAYKRLYKKITERLETGEAFIDIKNMI